MAIVTGGARGIGAAVVASLLDRGAEVCAVDLDPPHQADGDGDGPGAGGRVLGITGDLADPALPRAVFEAALGRFGHVDILVNNAGYYWDAPLHRMTDDQFTAMLEIHALVPFRLMREAVSRWRPLAKGELEIGALRHRKIVNVSSRAALVGLSGAANYAAGKSALLGLTRSAARENAKLGINVNAVAFGAVDTRLNQPMSEGNSIHSGGRTVPLGTQKPRPAGPGGVTNARSMSGRAASAEEAARTIVYLCSSMSDLVNGEVIQVNS